MNEDDRFPELEDGVLLAYLDGAVDTTTEEQIEQALAQDPALYEKLQYLARLQGHLETHLHHATAPTAFQLGEYVMGLLSPEEAAALEQKLAAYPHHQRELAFLQTYLADLELPPEEEGTQSWTEQLREQTRIVVAQLVDSLSGAGRPGLGLMGIRGAEPVQQSYEAGDAQLFLEIQDSTEHLGQKLILGLVAGLVDATTFTVYLLRQDDVAASTALDVASNFVFDDIPPGDYTLLVRGPSLEIVIPGLTVA